MIAQHIDLATMSFRRITMHVMVPTMVGGPTDDETEIPTAPGDAA
jgi:hypothetical protein